MAEELSQRKEFSYQTKMENHSYNSSPRQCVSDYKGTLSKQQDNSDIDPVDGDESYNDSKKYNYSNHNYGRSHVVYPQTKDYSAYSTRERSSGNRITDSTASPVNFKSSRSSNFINEDEEWIKQCGINQSSMYIRGEQPKWSSPSSIGIHSTYVPYPDSSSVLSHEDNDTSYKPVYPSASGSQKPQQLHSYYSHDTYSRQTPSAYRPEVHSTYKPSQGYTTTETPEVAMSLLISTPVMSIAEDDSWQTNRQPNEPSGRRPKRNKLRGGCELYQIVTERILTAEDNRQFIMIKNIPNSWSSHIHSTSQEKLLSILDNYVKYQIEFLYLPHDKSTLCNLGYGYVSLLDTQAVLSLYQAMHMKRWPNSSSLKLCEVVYARIQGHRDYMKMCDRWSVMNENPKYQPIFFRRMECLVDGVKLTRMIRTAYADLMNHI